MPQLTSPPAQIVADTIVRTVELGVRIADAALAGETTVLWCDLLVEGPGSCPGCGRVGVYRDSVERRVSDVPVVGHPLQLRVRVPRYRCRHDDCVREVFAHDTSRLARPGWSTTRRCAGFVLRRLAVDKATVAAIAGELGRSWDTVNQIAVATTSELLLTAGPARLDGVRVLGVDEHRWAHTRHADGQGYVTVIVDLTPVMDGHGPARLLDVVAGRSAAAMTGWLAQRDQRFRDRVESRLRRPRPPTRQDPAHRRHRPTPDRAASRARRTGHTLGRTLHRRRDDILAYFTHRASNGPTEAINGRLEALRRNALGFRNLINYRIRSLLHSGNLAL